MGVLTFLDRMTYDAYNLGWALIGPPTGIFVIAYVMTTNSKFVYIIFAIICFIYMIYMIQQWWSGAADKATETQIYGDSGPANDSYLISIIILSIYVYISYNGYKNYHTLAHVKRGAAVSHGVKRAFRS